MVLDTRSTCEVVSWIVVDLFDAWDVDVAGAGLWLYLVVADCELIRPDNMVGISAYCW